MVKVLKVCFKKRDADLSGIKINGLDYEDYNPETDKYIFKNFDVHNAIAIKGDNKEQLQKKIGLTSKSQNSNDWYGNSFS